MIEPKFPRLFVTDATPPDRIYLISQRKWIPGVGPEPEEEWAKRCCVIYNIGEPKGSTTTP